MLPWLGPPCLGAQLLHLSNDKVGLWDLPEPTGLSDLKVRGYSFKSSTDLDSRVVLVCGALKSDRTNPGSSARSLARFHETVSKTPFIQE